MAGENRLDSYQVSIVISSLGLWGVKNSPYVNFRDYLPIYNQVRKSPKARCCW